MSRTVAKPAINNTAYFRIFSDDFGRAGKACGT